MAGSVSAAMIVRDEADRLADCLESLLPWVDEVRVVDTGSEDDTLAVARQYGIEPVVIPWTGDFSAARNRSLDLCRGDWIFAVDADERLAPDDIPILRAATGRDPDCGFRFTTRNYTDRTDYSGFHPCPPTDPFARGFPGWFPSAKVRLFPNRPGIRFDGPVHELVNPALERIGLPIHDSPVPIHHYPLLRSPERLRHKQALYLELGMRKVRRNPQDPQAHAELGHQYAELGDLAPAIDAYRHALRLAPGNALVLKDLGAVLHLAGHAEKALQALEIAVKVDPASAEAWRNLGVVHGAAGRWADAARCFDRALQLQPAWVDGIRCLSVALEHCGRPEEACAAARRAFDLAPHDPACIDNFVGQMVRLGRRLELCRIFEEAAASGAASDRLRDALARL